MKKITTLHYVLFFTSFYAFAFEPKYGINPSIDIEKLKTTHETVVTPVTRSDRTFLVESSTVSEIEAAKVFQSATDYDRYTEMKMPKLAFCKIVARPAPDHFIIFSDMKASIGRSAQYLSVHIKTFGPKKFGIEWEKTEMPAGLPKELQYEEKTSFSKMYGSFYMEDLPSNSTKPQTYIRYALENTANFNPIWPAPGIISKQLSEGVVDVVKTVVNDAKKH